MMLPPERSSSKIIADIEVLRAFAVILVIFNHRHLLLKALYGDPIFGNYFQFYCGVDLFFVISGFVIARGLLPIFARASSPRELIVSVIAFWIRRIWRIWPTAWLWGAVGLVMAGLFGGVWGSLHGDLLWMVATVLNVANVFQWSHFDQFGSPIFVSGAPFFVYWSLSLEEQFYIVLPLILLVLPRKWLPLFLAITIVGQFFLYRPHPDLLWFFRSDGLLIGVAIALSLSSPVRSMLEPTILERPWLRYVTTAFLLLLLMVVAAGNVVPFYTGLIAVIAGMLVWIASFDRNYTMPESILKRVFVWIGSRSYAIYVLHTVCFILTRRLWAHLLPGTDFDGRFAPHFIVTAALLIVGVAELNFRLVEAPLRRRGRVIAERFAAKHRAGLASDQPQRQVGESLEVTAPTDQMLPAR